MATEIWDKFRVAVEAQALNTPAADQFSAGTKSPIVKATGGNAAGCHTIKLVLEISTAPTSAARAEVYMETSLDGGSTWTEPRLCGSSPIVASTAKKYFMGDVLEAGEYTRFSWRAIGYQMAGRLMAQGVVMEQQ